MDPKRLLSLRSRLGHTRRNIKHGWKGTGWSNTRRPTIVPDSWLIDALETQAFELEHMIVEELGVDNETIRPHTS